MKCHRLINEAACLPAKGHIRRSPRREIAEELEPNKAGDNTKKEKERRDKESGQINASGYCIDGAGNYLRNEYFPVTGDLETERHKKERRKRKEKTKREGY